MRKAFLVTLCAGLPALVMSCSSDSGGDKSGGSSTAPQGGSSSKASTSSPSETGGNSAATGGKASTGGATTATGGTNGAATSATGGKSSTGGAASSATGGKSSTGGAASSATGGKSSTGGAATTTTSAPTGGATSPGSSSGGASAAAGGSSAAPSGGASAASGGSSSPGSAGSSAAAGGSSSAGSSAGGSAPVPSKGCGKADGVKTITAGGSSVPSGLPTSTKLKIGDREFIIDIPADYDPSHPYRLIFSWHQAYGSANGNANGQFPAGNGPNFDAKNYAFFGLRREATNANQPSIFVAPQGIGDFPWDYTRDVKLFDDLLALVDANLCIDDSRVFATGFSFGAMMSYALSITRQTKLRAVATMAAADYNLPGEPTDTNAGPVAYLGFTGMSDGTCPWVRPNNSNQGGKACVLTHAKDNGCTIPGTIQTTTVGSKKYLCYDFEGCKAGYPVKVCTFDGAHTPSSVDDGSSTGDDGLKAFVPPIAWKFFAQF